MGDKLDKLEEDLHSYKAELIGIKKDIQHIRERLDNGMSNTITEVAKELREFITYVKSEINPAVKDSQFWVGKIKWGSVWLIVIALSGGIAKIFMEWIIK